MIFIISGQTASGKTTLALEIAEKLKLERLISHTTRPMRVGETNGVEYHFVSDEEFNELNLICKNTFNTAFGPWSYGLNVDGIDPNKNYIAILEAAGAKELKEAMGEQAHIIYIDVSERTRKKRAYARENKKKDPEIERRFKSDAEDFADFKEHSDVIVKNIHKDVALAKIEKFILKQTTPKKLKSKYGAKKVVVDGINFDSKAEAKYYQELVLKKKQKQIIDFQLQPVYELLPEFTINEVKRQPIKYKADFIVAHLDGTTEVIDIKGFETTDFKLKKKLFEFKYNKELICLAYSQIDGGWIKLDQLKKNRAARRKAKKKK